jgi:transposase-like protein
VSAVQAGREATAKRNRKDRSETNLVNLIERFGSEDKCYAFLEGLRWPDGVKCLRCGSDKISRVTSFKKLRDKTQPSGYRTEPRRQFDCDSCRYQFSVKVGTLFHDSHLPLWKWFLSTYMMIESKKGVSANQLKRTLDVSYKTAWFQRHRIRHAMDVADPKLLTGTVEVDETYVGGRAKNRPKSVRMKNKGRKGGQGYKGDKTMVLSAIQRGGKVRFAVERRDATHMVLKAFIGDHVHADAAIYTDSHPGYRKLRDGGIKHEAVDHSAEEWVRADVHTNTVESVFSLLKRSIIGSYHQLSAKHLESYLDEIAFKFNHRHNPFLFRDTLLAMLDAEKLTYAELVEVKEGR